MSQYFNLKKFRRQSKQLEPETETKTKTETQDAKEPISSPPAPTVASSSEEPASSPLLDDEDEKFLTRLAALTNEPEGTPPPLPDRPDVVTEGGERKVGKDAQEALMAGADKIPLPTSPPEVTVEDTAKGKNKSGPGGINRRKSVMSYFNLAQSKFKRADKKASDKDRAKAADDLQAAAEIAKTTGQQEEEQDLIAVLDQLNLSAVNNRVFSFSKESEELLNRFKVVLKDIVNGVPTAYDDLTKLLTDSDAQMKKMYSSMPPFLQNLIKSLPAKMTATLGPELLAAQAEKPGFDGKQREEASQGKSKKKRSKRSMIPDLKSLISAEGAVATMLKSILNFLKLRFPALMAGTNILLSLAVFLLLFVFWYCHKRGRETRLEKEGLAAKDAESALASSASSITDDADSLLSNKGEPSKTQNSAAEAGGKEAPKERDLNVDDMPSVSHLPDPKTVPLPETPAKEKEEPVKST